MHPGAVVPVRTSNVTRSPGFNMPPCGFARHDGVQEHSAYRATGAANAEPCCQRLACPMYLRHSLNCVDVHMRGHRIIDTARPEQQRIYGQTLRMLCALLGAGTTVH